MKVRTTIKINDTITNRDAARLAGFMVKLKPQFIDATVTPNDDMVTVRWYTTMGTVVEAAQVWYPMLLACWLHIDRDIATQDITEALIEEIP